MVIHNSTTPMAAAENFANSVVTMEWGYTHLRTGVPAPGHLPPEWNFMGSRSRAVIGYGSVANDATPLVRKRFLTLAMLTGVAPWTATDDDLTTFKPLQGLAFPRYRFWDCQRSRVACSTPDCGAAVYATRHSLVLIAGNFGTTSQKVELCFDPSNYGFKKVRALEWSSRNKTTIVRRERYDKMRFSLRLPAGDTRVITFQPK